MKEIIIGLLTIFFGLALILGKLWLIGSLLTSGVKAVSKSCDQTYVIERLVDGHWFCPDKETK